MIIFKWVLVLAIALLCAACDEREEETRHQYEAAKSHERALASIRRNTSIRGIESRPVFLARIDMMPRVYRDSSGAQHICAAHEDICRVHLQPHDALRAPNGTYSVEAPWDCTRPTSVSVAIVYWYVMGINRHMRMMVDYPRGMNANSPEVDRLLHAPDCPSQEPSSSDIRL